MARHRRDPDTPRIGEPASRSAAKGVAHVGARNDNRTRLRSQHPLRESEARQLDGAMEELVQAGEHAEAFPGIGKYRPDAFTMPIALQYLRTSAPPVLHVGLGDADEWGHRNDYGAYLEAIGKSDAFIGQIADTLDAMGDIGARTTVIVTTDHGRNSDFQHHGTFSASSARTFVMAFGARVKARGVGCSDRDVTLADIAPTVRALVGLPADESSAAGRPIEEIVGAPNHLVVGATGAGGSAGAVQRP